MQDDRDQLSRPTAREKVSRSCLKVRASPAGIHIFDRSTGYNVLVDEVRVPQRFWSNAPRNISVALTNACDLHCPYCYAPKERAVLDIERLYWWLDELDAHGCLGVGFGGGEPTLSQHLPSLCRFVTCSTGMAATFTTHGHRLDDRLVAELRGNVHFIRVSMDGVGPTYERLRGRSFQALLSNIAKVRTFAPFGINFVVNAETLPDLDQALALAVKLGAVELLLLPEQPARGRKGIDSCTRDALCDWVASYKSPLRLTVSEGGAAGLPTCHPLAEEDGLRGYAHIDAAGRLKRSSYDPFGVPIGSGGVMEALQALQKITGGV